MKPKSTQDKSEGRKITAHCLKFGWNTVGQPCLPTPSVHPRGAAKPVLKGTAQVSVRITV